jgi:hypothetical protein
MQRIATSTTSSAGRARKAWVLALGGLLIVLALAAAALLALRPGRGVPPDLDYSTTRLSAAGLYRASFSVSEPAVPVNQLHSWILHVETAGGQPVADAQIAVDGDMPEHGHGLPTRPQVTQNLGNGDYLVEGMKFQMGGWWVIDFDITANGQPDRVSFNLLLK